MIRVLHYGLSSNTGGIETYLLRLAQHVDPAAFQFDFVYNDLGKPCFHTELSALGSRFYPITPRRISPRRNRQDLEDLFERECFDIVHCHLNTLSYVEPVRVALRHKSLVLVHSHNSGTATSLATTMLHRLHFATLPRKRITMVAVSQLAGQWLFGRDAPFTVINNGIEADRFTFSAQARERVRRDLGLGDRFVVGNVGAFLPAKNHEFILDTFGALSRAVPGAVLLLVGHGPLENTVRAMVAEKGLGEGVRFLGVRSDVPDLLSAMDCLLFPSRYEGFPLTVLEAQAAGLPCVISDAITEEVVVTPWCVRLPLEASADEWAEAIWCERPQLDRGAASVLVADAGFSVTTTVRKVEATYHSMLTDSGRDHEPEAQQ